MLSPSRLASLLSPGASTYLYRPRAAVSGNSLPCRGSRILLLLPRCLRARPQPAGRVRGGAMNAGDSGSGTQRCRIASMSLFDSVSIRQPSTSPTGSS